MTSVMIRARLALLAFALAALWQTQSMAQSAAPAPWPAPTPTRPGQFSSAPTPAPQQPAAWPAAPQQSAVPQGGSSHPAWGSGGQPTAAPSNPAWGGGPPQARPSGGGGSPCDAEFVPLRTDAQNKGNAIRAAAERKAAREEICQAFKNFVAAEAKVVKFIEVNGGRCGIPPNVPKMMRTNHNKSIAIRNQVCNAARASAPPPPSLSDALGTSRIPDTSSVKTGRGGTFDTLQGSPLAR